jgi:hypothetical protein
MNEDFLRSLSDDGLIALKQVCDAFQPLVFETRRQPRVEPKAGVDAYLEFYSLLRAIVKTHGIGLPEKGIEGDDYHIQQTIVEAFRQAQAHAHTAITKREAGEKIQMLEDHFKLFISKPFAYEFTEDDIAKIQKNINALRELIGGSEQIDQNHKQRLLKRLERLQQELHKKISDLDRFWGLIGDASVVLKKLGEDATPLVEHVKSIMEIIWRAQTKAHSLPEGTKFPLISDGKDIEQSR